VVEHTMDVSVWLRKQLEETSPDLLRVMVKDFAEALMSADADAVCGAGYGERTPDRVNRRNGYRERDWDTRVGSIELAVPKLREGSYFPDWLLAPRRRAEQAFVSVIADAYLAGVSTRRVEKLVQQLGVERMSKSQVSRLAKSLDQIVEDFRTRPLDGAPYAYVTLYALVVKCREGGRTVNVCVVHAVGVNKDGFRESLGLDVVTAEDGAAWLAYVRGLVARGLAGVKLVSSDAHPGLVDAIAATLTGASWQRCRTHFMRNLLTRVPKSAQGFVATMVRTIFAQPDAATVHEQHARIVASLEDRFPEAAALLDEAGPDLLAFTGFPKEHWRQLWSTDENVKGADGIGEAGFGRRFGRGCRSQRLRVAPVASICRRSAVFGRARPFAAPASGRGEGCRRPERALGLVVGAGDPGRKSGASGMEALPRRIAA
jgi:putative transposase